MKDTHRYTQALPGIDMAHAGDVIETTCRSFFGVFEPQQGLMCMGERQADLSLIFDIF
jgi:hypothetical protein